jgi:hypothetical protein
VRQLRRLFDKRGEDGFGHANCIEVFVPEEERITDAGDDILLDELDCLKSLFCLLGQDERVVPQLALGAFDRAVASVDDEQDRAYRGGSGNEDYECYDSL